MKKMIIMAYLAVIFAANNVYPQNGVAINTTGTPADPSAMLDVNSNIKGILIPRVSEIERLNIVNPANGLLVYQTDNDE
ncbi:MAG TPA: hypothetical protein P5250_01835 [Bacteroidales bacterium]|nr:hypothetical protein [Bacteroidales bacterium]